MYTCQKVYTHFFYKKLSSLLTINTRISVIWFTKMWRMYRPKSVKFAEGRVGRVTGKVSKHGKRVSEVNITLMQSRANYLNVDVSRDSSIAV